jgi:hypothetical protein
MLHASQYHRYIFALKDEFKNILCSNRYLEHFLVDINWDYMLAYINFPLTSMQRVGGEYQL